MKTRFGLSVRHVTVVEVAFVDGFREVLLFEGQIESRKTRRTRRTEGCLFKDRIRQLILRYTGNEHTTLERSSHTICEITRGPVGIKGTTWNGGRSSIPGRPGV